MTEIPVDKPVPLDLSTKDNPDFLLAVQLQSEGRHEEAAAVYSRIIATDNRHFQSIHNLAGIIAGMGHRERALGLYELATKLEPRYASAYCNWGVILKNGGDIDEVTEKFEMAAKLDPDMFPAQANLAELYRIKQQFPRAIKHYENAIRIDPDQLEMLNNLGVCYRALNENKLAAECFQKALAINPDYVDAVVNLGNALGALGLHEHALQYLRKGVELQPDLAAAHNNLGIALADLGHQDEAMECYSKAISLNAKSHEAVSNLANVLNSSGESDKALAKLEEAIALKPDYSAAYNNMGNALKDMGRYSEAIEKFKQAVEIEPDFAEANANLGYMHLLEGRFLEGWDGYAWRGKVKGQALARRVYDQPDWDGSDLAGKHIYVYPEQGLGDIVQFSRYTTLLKKHGAEVTLELPKQLIDLFQGLEDVDHLHIQDTPPPLFDLHVSIMDLPQMFGTTLEIIPNPIAYLKADEGLATKWSERLAAYEKFRVGFVWAGNPKHTNDRNRSLAIEHIRPLVERDEIDAFSLQVGRNGEATSVFGDQIIDLASDLTSFAETAAAMKNMDLIISVDTSPLHVAGALGRPVWGLIPFVPDWRWLLERTDSPWYPTLQLFRQDDDKLWEPVISRVAEALVEKTK